MAPMTKTVIALAALFVAAAPTAALADDEASNRPVVFASQVGNCYARSIPSGTYGDEGRTEIYFVEAEADRLIHTYAWYAHTLRLECNITGPDGSIGHSVVQFGPWPRGQEADEDTLALDDPARLTPSAHYWVKRKLPWVQAPAGVRCIEDDG